MDNINVHKKNLQAQIKSSKYAMTLVDEDIVKIEGDITYLKSILEKDEGGLPDDMELVSKLNHLKLLKRLWNFHNDTLKLTRILIKELPSEEGKEVCGVKIRNIVLDCPVCGLYETRELRDGESLEGLTCPNCAEPMS
jgi:hypothetical protein